MLGCISKRKLKPHSWAVKLKVDLIEEIQRIWTRITPAYFQSYIKLFTHNAQPFNLSLSLPLSLSLSLSPSFLKFECGDGVTCLKHVITIRNIILALIDFIWILYFFVGREIKCFSYTQNLTEPSNCYESIQYNNIL